MVKQRSTLRDRIDQKVFNALYSRSLVYNACWEDPAVDRRALALRPTDTVLAITARSIEEQSELYERRIRPQLWGAGMNWALSQQIVLSLLGVPHPQRREVQAQHVGGIAGFVRESIEYLVRHLPFRSNYFYAVYVRGRYSPACCPEYLKAEQFARLKAGLAERIVPCTGTDRKSVV